MSRRKPQVRLAPRIEIAIEIAIARVIEIEKGRTRDHGRFDFDDE